MKMAQMHRRLAKLSAKFRTSGVRQFTLEQLCRLYWRTDKRGFRAVAAETGAFSVFLTEFEREDAERAQTSSGDGTRCHVKRPTRRRTA
jgi:hypothetical protein